MCTGYSMIKQSWFGVSGRLWAEALNEAAGRREAAGFNRAAVNTSRDDDVIT